MRRILNNREFQQMDKTFRQQVLYGTTYKSRCLLQTKGVLFTRKKVEKREEKCTGGQEPFSNFPGNTFSVTTQPILKTYLMLFPGFQSTRQI